MSRTEITAAINRQPARIHHSYQILRNLCLLYLDDEGLMLHDIESDIVRHLFRVEMNHGTYSSGMDEHGDLWLYPCDEIEEYYPMKQYSIPSLKLLEEI